MTPSPPATITARYARLNPRLKFHKLKYIFHS